MGLECDLWGSSPKLEDFNYPHLMTQEFGHLSIMPLYPKFTGELFEALHSIPPIKCLGSKSYRLPLATIQSWQRIERDLVRVVEILNWQKTGYVVCGHPLPSMLGYMQTHATERIARRQAIRSRDWFAILMASVSYLAHSFKTDTWFKMLADKNVPQTWIANLQMSEVCATDIERVGAFIIFKDPARDFPELKYLERLNVPMWYPWGEREVAIAKAMPQMAYFWYPTQEQLESPAILNFYDTIPPHVPDNQPAISQTPQSPPKVSLSRPGTPPSPHSGQKPGQTWQEFFKARDERRAQRTETAKEREVRISRERNPGTRKATFFEWLENSAGEYIRHRLPRGEGLRLFDYYHPDQRKYDAANNIWDYCEDFAENPASYDDSDDGYDEPDLVQSFQASDLVPQVDSFLVPQPSRLPLEDECSALLEIPSILANRHGFVLPQTQLTPPIVPSSTSEQRKTMEALGFKSLKFVGPRLMQDAIVDFVADLIGVGPGGGLGIRDNPVQLAGLIGGARSNASPAATKRCTLSTQPKNSRNETPASPRSELWDLNSRNDRNIFIMSRMRYARCVSAPSSRTASNVEHWFLLALPDDKSTSWILSLSSAIDLLHACRLPFRTTQEIARFLLKTGIPFRTLVHLGGDWCVRQPATSNMSFLPMKMEIPLRYKEYQFSFADYAVYEYQRDKLLSQHHARAARELGGIVWRLAESAFNEDDILDGPSRTSTQYGIGIFIKDSSHPGFLCDDSLTDHELDLICGLHEVWTGKYT